MRKLLLLSLLFLCLTGCAVSQPTEVLPVLYYEKTELVMGDEMGVLATQTWEYGTELPDFLEFTNKYVQGPTADKLKSPFPKELKAQSVQLEDGVLTVIFNQVYDHVVGFEKSVMDGCLTATLTQFETVSSVILQSDKTQNTEEGTSTSIRLASDFLLDDGGIRPTESVVRLYHCDAGGRYLVVSDQVTDYLGDEAIPTSVLNLLIEGPSKHGQYPTMPEGTHLLSVELDDTGLCTVNFSAEFLYNKPTDQWMERITIFSVVNSLTELKSVKRVLFLAEAQPIETYLYMDLSKPLERDNTMMDSDQSDLDGTIFVAAQDGQTLAAMPVGYEPGTILESANNHLGRLLTYQPINGYENALPKGTAIRNVDIYLGTCYVDFNSSFLSCAGDEQAETMAVRSVVATLSNLSGIVGVSISVNGQNAGFDYVDLTQTYKPNPSWFYPE